ncbi:AAA family ATPase [Pyrococcus horikoshii]|nr:ATP-binding protein [Pyrococcus horikoshii]
MEEDCLWDKRRKIVDDLFRTVLRGNIAILLGPRRVGKTSVVNVISQKFAKRRNHHYIYFNFSRFIGARAISIADIEPKRTSLKLITTSKSYVISLKGISVEVRKTSIEEFTSDFSTLVRILSQNSERGLLIFDEAQVLARLKNLDFRGLIQEITDSYPNISMIFTGSMPGLLIEYLNPGPDKPNFMRASETFTLSRWNVEEGLEFLKKGFESYGISVRNELELERAVKELGGIPGFISYYGITVINLVRSGVPVEKALPRALEESKRYALEEWKKDLEAFLNVYNSPIYVEVMKVLASSYPTALKGAEVYRRMNRAPKRIQHIYKYLDVLEKVGFIRSEGGKYWIEDPILRELLT